MAEKVNKSNISLHYHSLINLCVLYLSCHLPGGVTLEFFWDHACSKNRGKGGTFEVKTRTAFSGKRGVISDRVPRFPYLGVFFISLYFRV